MKKEKRTIHRADGRFMPGMSGNPDGRPKGSKNQITLLKESMELLLRNEASPEDLRAVMREALTQALAGDRGMIKLILELHMSKGTTTDNSKAAEKVQINITGPSAKVEKEVVASQPETEPEVAPSHEVH